MWPDMLDSKCLKSINTSDQLCYIVYLQPLISSLVIFLKIRILTASSWSSCPDPWRSRRSRLSRWLKLELGGNYASTLLDSTLPDLRKYHRQQRQSWTLSRIFGMSLNHFQKSLSFSFTNGWVASLWPQAWYPLRKPKLLRLIHQPPLHRDDSSSLSLVTRCDLTLL